MECCRGRRMLQCIMVVALFMHLHFLPGPISAATTVSTESTVNLDEKNFTSRIPTGAPSPGNGLGDQKFDIEKELACLCCQATKALLCCINCCGILGFLKHC